MVAAVSLDAAIQVAEDYFNRSGLLPVLVDVLGKLAKEQPKDAVAALQKLLASSGETHDGGKEGEDEEEEATDMGTDMATVNLEMEPMGLVTLERLPRAKGTRGQDLSQRRCWAGGFNRPLLEGWLPQGSPCCGAASLAGAFNALFDYGRNNPKSSSIVEVAEHMAKNCDRLFQERQKRVERLLGFEDGAFDLVLAALDTELLVRDLDWVGSGDRAVTKTVALAVLRELLTAWTPTACTEAETVAKDGAFTILRRALGIETAAEEEADDDTLVSGKIVVGCGPDWDAEIGELLVKRRGSMRLRAEKPNTGEIGSWGIKQAATDLSIARGCDALSSQVLIGRKGGPKVEVAVAKDDTDEAIVQQWASLIAAFGKPGSVLLFHLTNHYALIYGWREWIDEADCGQSLPRARRQILTARKGQRPTVWMDFEEARSIMIGWSGYHVLQLQRTPSPTVAGGVEVGKPGGA